MTTPSSRRRRTGFAAALLAATALTGAFGWNAYADQQAQPGAITPPAVQAPNSGPPGFADLVTRVRPAVVTITATERVAQRDGSPFPRGSEQDRMFRRFFGGPETEQPRAAQALGSGFLIDAEGHVVTNNHVVDGATAIRVTLDDKREFTAQVVGRDPRTDLALLKVDAGANLPFLRLGDSDAARPGDWVVALGNPYGLGGTVTAGIVSARGRDIGAGPYDDFLQVDAPINRGNSGGPLFSASGDVIGVNTAIFSPSGGSIGIGFAIPSNMVKQVVAQLEAHGRVERGFLGAATQQVTPALAQAMRLPAPEGALVATVEDGSPAARAGLQPGDVVTKVDSTRITSPRDLARAIGDAQPGSTVALDVRREGGAKELHVTLAQLREKGVNQQAEERDANGGAMGIALAPLDGAARQALRIPRNVEGAVVAAVRPDSVAAEAGLQPGDVITAVGQNEVKDAESAARAIREATRNAGDAVALRVLRDGRNAFVALQAPKNQG